ncbi:MAG: SUMF1/EgtB/PvdO family nonheme iron enzyme, partial [Planctomycetota bacterium]
LSAIRSVLQPQAVHLNERLWSRAVDVAANPEDRFRAACMLSTFDPDDPRWQNLAGITTTVLLEQDPISAGAWSRLLQPAAAWIFDAMATTFRMREEASALKKELTARLLVRFGSNRTLALCELIAEADRDEFIILFDALRASEEEVTPKLLEQLYQVSLKREANESDGLRNRPATEADLQTARRQSNLILALYRLGESEPLWDALRLTPNPTLRSWLITHLASIGADPNGLVKQLFNESNLSVSRALILCLGHYRPADLDEGHRNALMTRLHHDFATHRDPGVHSACDWTLRQWGVDVDAPENLQTSIGATEEDQSNKQDPLKRRELSEGQDTPGWFLDENGHTMVQFAGPIEFRSGILQKLDAPELATVPTFSRIGHGFAISTTEVTRQQFGEFVREMNFDFDFNAFDQIVGTSPTHPRTAVYYFDAAAYCNWLSKKAGLPSSEWCYEPALNGQWTIGSRTKANAIELRGYRLPTEMEWEYACRADASTAWSFGDEVELLSHYAWHRGNSNDQLQQVKQLLPNDFGLFDHHGNALELCINLFSKLDTRISDERSSDRHYQFPNASTTYLDIPTRGGWARDHARQLRAGSRNHSIGMNRILKNGFRIARTVSNDRETERVERKLGLPQPFRMPSERHHFLLPQVSFRDADSFTVEAWVQDWKGPLLSLGMNGPTSPRFTIGSLAVVWNQGNRPPQLARFRNAPPFGIHHRAVVYDGEALTVYLDGQVVAELTTNQVPDVSPDRPVFIGRVEGGANAFARGDLYLLEVSDTARYREPFRPEPRLRPDDHTLRFYDFSKIVGDRLPDLSRHQRHGTLLKTDRNGDAEH